MDATQVPAQPGTIDEHSAYTLGELKARMRINDEALRQARRAGLRARKVGRRKYYLGREVIEFLRRCPEV